MFYMNHSAGCAARNCGMMHNYHIQHHTWTIRPVCHALSRHSFGILLDSPTGSWQASRGSAEHVALDNQGNDSQALVAPGRQGASALACRGAVCSSRAQVSRRAGTQSGIHIGHPCGMDIAVRTDQRNVGAPAHTYCQLLCPA